MRCVVIERRLEVPEADGSTRIYPAGWTGTVEEDRAESIVASGAGRIDEERELTVAPAEAGAEGGSAGGEGAAPKPAKGRGKA